MRPTSTLQLPRPGRGLRGILIGLLATWLVFALALNWGGVSERPFLALALDPKAVLEGELWRLFTAPLLHDPTAIGHILTALIGLYFLSPQLEETWGTRRFLRFVGLSAVLSYGTQALLLRLLPSDFAARLAGPSQFGALPVVEAVAIAWACSFRGRIVQLFFVLPLSSKGLILFVVGISVLSLIAGQTPPSGHLALFVGMALGWLLGGGTPSPVRRAYLRFRLARLDQEVESERQDRRRRLTRSNLRVIEGGEKKGKGPKLLH